MDEFGIRWKHPTNGWFVHQKPTELVMLTNYLNNKGIKKILEIGTATGGTAMYWANWVLDDGIVYTLDNRNDNKCYKGTMYEQKIVEMVGDTHDIAFKFEVFNKVGPVDLLFIDGDHSYEGVREDFFSFYPLVRRGGFIALHDIVDSEYHRERGCFVAKFWKEIDVWHCTKSQFIETREIPGVNTPVLSMGIGLVEVGL